MSVLDLRLAVRKRGPSVYSAAWTIAQQELLQVVPHRDLPRFATFLREPERVLRPVVHEVLHGQLGDRPDAGRRVDEHRQYGPVRSPTGFEMSIDFRSVSTWSGADLGVLPSTIVYRSALTVAAGLMTQTVAIDQAVEEPPQRCQVQFQTSGLIAPRSSGEEDQPQIETFHRNPAGNQSRPVEPGQQPEASLAWRAGDHPCEA